VFHLAMYLLFESDTEVLPATNGSYIFSPGPLKQVAEDFRWSRQHHRVNSQLPVVACCKVSVVFCRWTWTSSDLLAQSKAQAGESDEGSLNCFVQRAAE
jgi:hypothetical protein